MTQRVVAIMAPTYLPWIGYFDMIDRADIFVLLESVQFKKRSWQQRNRIKTSSGEMWLSVPVLTKGRMDQVISDVEIVPDQDFRRKHVETVARSYADAPYASQYLDSFEAVMTQPLDRLCQLNNALIEWLCVQLQIDANFLTSHDVDYSGTKARLLHSICTELGADCYLSADGSKPFIDEDDVFTENGMDVTYHGYEHPTYQQLHGPFVPYMSVLDLLFNEGPNSLAVIRAGRSSERSNGG